MRSVVLSLVLLACAGLAQGEPRPAFEQASAAFQNGEFLHAASLGAEVGDPDGLALAARALLAEAVYRDSEPPASLLAEAERLARLALDEDPHHIEARLQLAISWSLQLRAMSNGEVRRSGLGGATRDLALSVLEDDPGNAYAHGLLAVWNVEVVRRGGAIGSAIMGASVQDGLDHYQEAIAQAPGEASLHWQMARVLASLDARRYRGQIDSALDSVQAADADGPLLPVLTERAGILSAALQSQPARDVERLAEQML